MNSVILLTASSIAAFLALISIVLLLWQWVVALRFPLHRRVTERGYSPAVTLLKPLKGSDPAAEECLRSWFGQEYSGAVQILFGVASVDDPACKVVRSLLQEFPNHDAKLVVCGPLAGSNGKVSKLAQLEAHVAHDVIIVSDADVKVPKDFVQNVVAPLKAKEVGLVNCFYRLANPVTAAMRWEAVAINADFWSQVLQARTLKPLDFALGAAMAIRREKLAGIGGYMALADCLADDYQLGNRIVRRGGKIELSPVVVECWSRPMGWAAVWKHQLRWARTIRVSQPAPYFFSILSNSTLWPLIWLAVQRSPLSLSAVAGALVCRIAIAIQLQHRLYLVGSDQSVENLITSVAYAVILVPLKDLLQASIWLCAFLGNRIEWAGETMTLRRDGILVPAP